MIFGKDEVAQRNGDNFGYFFAEPNLYIFALIGCFKTWFVVGVLRFHKWFDVDVLYFQSEL